MPLQSGALKGRAVEEPEILTYEEVAKRFAIKRSTLYALVAQQRLPFIRLGPRFIRFSRSSLEAFFASHSVEPKGGGR
jgi:excisionase family DNA binding protein